MPENKTRPTTQSVAAFIDAIDGDTRRHFKRVSDVDTAVLAEPVTASVAAVRSPNSKSR